MRYVHFVQRGVKKKNDRGGRRRRRTIRRRRRTRTIRRRRRRRVVGGSGAISGFVYGRADSHPSLQRADRQTLSLRGVTIIPVIVIVVIVVINHIIIIIVVVIGVHIIHQCSHACHGWRDGRGARRGTRNLPLPTYSSHFSSTLIFYSHFAEIYSSFWEIFFQETIWSSYFCEKYSRKTFFFMFFSNIFVFF